MSNALAEWFLLEGWTAECIFNKYYNGSLLFLRSWYTYNGYKI